MIRREAFTSKLVGWVGLLCLFGMPLAADPVPETVDAETLATLGVDAVLTDPAFVDEKFPASLVELGINSHGSRLNAILYLAQGQGPHPTVVLLHGFPGNEKNLDLAQSMRRAGFNVLFFHYRGSWGSAGSFSFSHGLEDVEAVLSFLRRKEIAAQYRVDATRLTLVGHSMGGFMALITAANDSAVRCTVSIAGANMGWLGSLARRGPDAAASIAAAMAGGLSPLRGTSGEALRDDLRDHAEAFDLVARAAALKRQRLLLIGGKRDRVVPLAAHHDPLVAALEGAGAAHLTSSVLDADHAFSDKRIALAQMLDGWLSRSCR